MDYTGLTIIEALPLSRVVPSGAEDLFRRLRGATIVQIGSTDEDGIEGGGLIIDYRLSAAENVHRVVFAFNESGMWVEFDTVSEDPSTPV